MPVLFSNGLKGQNLRVTTFINKIHQIVTFNLNNTPDRYIQFKYHVLESNDCVLDVPLKNNVHKIIHFRRKESRILGEFSQKTKYTKNFHCELYMTVVVLSR
jgi:hypothetical protein